MAPATEAPTPAPASAAAPGVPPAPAPGTAPGVQPEPAPAAAPGVQPGPAASDPACKGSVGIQNFFGSFRDPLPATPLYDPPGPRRVGLQAGHWRNDEAPAELGRLEAGAAGGGKAEWEVNLDVARRAAALLEATGIQVDLLPATVPPRYQANAFIALHADGDAAGQARGFKVARPGFSSLPDIDDRLVDAFNVSYAAATELPRDDEHISLRMRYYYAFNSRRFCHAVAPGVPQAILEMGYMTSETDRRWLIGDPGRLARGVADSVQAFLRTIP
jgi:hypothetical protein